MPARPWFPFYGGDYLADTSHLSNELHGCYLKLMIHAWNHDGVIPEHVRDISNILGVHTNRGKTLWGKLAGFWYLSGGGYRHKRIDFELAQAVDKQKKARKSAEARWHANASPKHMRSQCSPQPHTTEEEDQEPLPPSAAPVDNSRGNGQSPSLWDVARRELGGSYLGKLLGEFGEKAVEDAIVATLRKRPAEWKSYLTSILRKPRRGKSIDQLALEGGYTNEAK